MPDQPTREDLRLDPVVLLLACTNRLRCGWHDLSFALSAPRIIAGLCRRLIEAEATVDRLSREVVEGLEDDGR